jgi:hypothetical protein
MTAGQRNAQARPDLSVIDTTIGFLERGEAAWQAYLRNGQSQSAEAVIARLQAALEAKHAELSAKQAISCARDRGSDSSPPVSTG